VIDKKRVVALDTPAGLIAAGGGGVTVTFSADGRGLGFLHDVAGVVEVVREGRRIEASGDGPLLANVAAALVARGIALWTSKCNARPSRTSSLR
jgi:hypothetical protein